VAEQFQGEIGQEINYGSRDGSTRTLRANAAGVINAKFGIKRVAPAEAKPADKPKEG